jgi:hypothetical protein
VGRSGRNWGAEPEGARLRAPFDLGRLGPVVGRPAAGSALDLRKPRGRVRPFEVGVEMR